MVVGSGTGGGGGRGVVGSLNYSTNLILLHILDLVFKRYELTIVKKKNYMRKKASIVH